jgi:PT repeat.
MCFNAAKLWQLGWNSNRHLVVSSAQPSYIGEIAGFIDNPDIDGPPMLIKLDTPSIEDYFINFNLRDAFNSGTKEGGDEVLVVKAGDGNNYSESQLKAKLGAGSAYKIPNFTNGKELSVEVLSINIARRVADVRVCLGDCPPECTSNTQCNDNDPCTEDICSAGTCSFNRIQSESCSICPGQSVLDVTIITDRYPRETSWAVRNQCSNAIQIQGNGYTEGETAYRTGQICVPKGEYIFTINDSYGDGICCNFGSGSFAISYNGSPIDISPDQFSFGTSTSITFGEPCPGNEQSLPTVAPTANPTKTPTMSPTKHPTASPTASPTRINISCEDDPNFNLQLDNGNVRKCTWLTKNPKRKSTRIAAYCPRDAVKNACPVSCGSCAIMCNDDDNFIFELNNGKDKGCQWLTLNENAVQIRRERYCYTKASKSSKSSITPIGEACPFSCGLCSL